MFGSRVVTQCCLVYVR